MPKYSLFPFILIRVFIPFSCSFLTFNEFVSRFVKRKFCANAFAKKKKKKNKKENKRKEGGKRRGEKGGKRIINAFKRWKKISARQTSIIVPEEAFVSGSDACLGSPGLPRLALSNFGIKARRERFSVNWTWLPLGRVDNKPPLYITNRAWKAGRVWPFKARNIPPPSGRLMARLV